MYGSGQGLRRHDEDVGECLWWSSGLVGAASVYFIWRRSQSHEDIGHRIRPPQKTLISPTLYCLPPVLLYRDVVWVRQVHPRPQTVPQICHHLHGTARMGNDPMGWHHGWFTATGLLAKINTNCLFSSKAVTLSRLWFCLTDRFFTDVLGSTCFGWCLLLFLFFFCNFVADLPFQTSKCTQTAVPAWIFLLNKT